MKKYWVVFGLGAFAVMAAKQAGVFAVLKSDARLGRQAEGLFLLSTNQLLKPWGQRTSIPGRPVDLAFDSKKRILAVLNSRSVPLFDGSSGVRIAEIQCRSTSYAGLAFRPGDRELWASETTLNGPDSILVAKLSEVGIPGETTHIELPGHPVPAGIGFSADGSTAYVVFSRNNTVAVIDTETRRVKQEIPVGIAPFAVAVSRRGIVYVSNRGGRRPGTGDTVAPSSGSQVVTDPRTGSSVSGTITVIDAQTPAAREVEVGLAPSGLALSPDEMTLAVANGHSDTISLIQTDSLRRTDLKIPSYPEGTLGSQPVAVQFTPDGKTLYVACGGTNALAVVRTGKWTVLGATPTARFPSAIATDRDGRYA